MDKLDVNTPKPPSLGDRIRRFRESVGMERDDFAKRLSLSYDQISAYEKDRSEPRSGFWLLLKTEFPDVDITNILTGKESSGLLPVSKVPIVHSVHAGDLTQGFSDLEILGWTYTNLKDKSLFALKVEGDSMYPEVEEGDLALCAPERPFVNGKLHVVIAGSDEATLKRVFKRPAGFELVPANPEYHSQLLEDSEIIRILRVVQIVKET